MVDLRFQRAQSSVATMGRSKRLAELSRLVHGALNRGFTASSGAVRPPLGAGPAKALPKELLSQQKRSSSAVAAAVATTQPLASVVHVPAVNTDLYGAISAVMEGDNVQQGLFKNVDGHRFEDGRYKAFIDEVSTFIPVERQYSDPVRTMAYGTDASFYRLNPKLVVKVHNEEEVRKIMPIAKRLGVPITFRAAGTSLSGQAITDSVLIKLSHVGKNFRNYKVHVRAWLRGGRCGEPPAHMRSGA
jgi:D-lactate dehydrogenase